MSKTLFLTSAVAALCLLLGIFSGCTEQTQATSPVSTSSAATSDLAASIVASEYARMTENGFDPAGAKGLFSLDWRTMYNPANQTSRVVGEARAVGFEASGGTRPRGVDMGTVTLTTPSAQFDLYKHTGRNGDVAYSSSQGRRDAQATANDVAFSGGGAYRFTVTGGAAFSALDASVNAPGALLALTSPAKDATIGAGTDLNVSWTGGSPDGKMLLVVAAEPERPSGGPQQGGGAPPPGGGAPPPGGGAPPPGGGAPPPDGGGMMPPPPGGDQRPDSTRAIVIRLDGNPGSATITAAALSDLIQRTGAKHLRLQIDQMTMQEIAHDGGIVRLMIHNGDGTRLTIQ